VVVHQVGTTKQISLANVATDLNQLIQHVLRLDSLSDNAQTQGVTEVHGRPHHLGSGRGGIGAETAIDFDFIEWQCTEHGHRCVAGAEVIERDPHPHLVEGVEDVGGLLGAFKHAALCELQREKFRREIRGFKRGGNHIGQRGRDLQCGHVDGDTYAGLTALPVGGRHACVLQHLDTETTDQSGAFGSVHKTLNGQVARGFALPPKERFAANQFAAPKIEHRLVVDLDEVIVEAAAHELLDLAIPGGVVGSNGL